MGDDDLIPLPGVEPARTAREVVAGLGLRDEKPEGRPHAVAVMIMSADGRATVEGRSGGLGNPADRALFRELRAIADAVLVGPRTLSIEQYATLLEPAQRARRLEAGLPPEPILATVSRRAELPLEIPLLADPFARIQLYTGEDVEVGEWAAEVRIVRMTPDALEPAQIVRHLGEACGARLVVCEGGPTLLRALIAASCLDDLVITIAPLLVAGTETTVLRGDELEPPVELELRGTWRGGDHLFVHYARRR
ncbi:MAG: dihydrofolate reductase family protein [Acidimicrobiales bacterium]